MNLPVGAAFEIFNDVRGMVIFYMFILEEAAQTAGMAAYLAYRDGHGDEAAETANWNLTNIITPGRQFCDTLGLVGYPMNDAFKAYFDASEKSMIYYATHTPPAD